MWVSRKLWEVLNCDLRLNSGNLAFVIKIFHSQIMYRFGVCNSTWARFFMTVVVMAGYGHYEITDKNGIHKDARKPNTTGFNYAEKRVCDIMDLLFEKVNMDQVEKFLTLVDATRWTRVAYEAAAYGTVSDGLLLAVPSKMVSDLFLVASEIRGDEQLLPLIHAISRGEEPSFTISMNTCEAEKKGVRKDAIKRKMGQICLCAMTGNQQDGTDKEIEYRQTLTCVSDADCPGAPKCVLKRKPDGSMVHMETNGNGMQHSEIKDRERICNFFPMSNLFCSVHALVNRLGILPVEINPVVLSVYEWFCTYIKYIAGGMMDDVVARNFSRMVSGYKSRAVAHASWVNTLVHMATCKPREEVIRDMLLDQFFHALPITAIYSALHPMLARSVSMPSLVVSSIAAQHFALPVLTWAGFKDFIESDVVPVEGESLRDYRLIRDFLQQCIGANMFCPEDSSPFSLESNISCFITSPGTEDFSVVNAKTSIFRVRNAKMLFPDPESIFVEVARRIKALLGDELMRQFHMGPETSIYQNAVAYVCQKFSMDFRTLLGPNLYFGRRHMQKLGLLHHVPGILDYDEVDSPSFARQFLFNNQANNEVKSAAVGFNVWSLLALSALLYGFEKHPHVSHRFAQNFLKVLISCAPVGCLPGNCTNCPSFSVESVTTEYIVVSEKDRPLHFLRPIDYGFNDTGVMTLCPAIDQFLPEDMLHCSFLSSIARFYCCDIFRIKSRLVTPNYELCPNRPYAFHNPSGKEYGYVFVRSATETVEFNVFDEGGQFSTVNATYDNWCDYIVEHELVLLPMIFRPGACLRVEMDQKEHVSCIVKFDDDQPTRLKTSNMSYVVSLIDDDSFADVFFMDALHSLVRVGEVMYLDMQYLDRERDGHAPRPGKFLRVRLYVPNVKFPPDGYLYVSAKLNTHYGIVLVCASSNLYCSFRKIDF